MVEEGKHAGRRRRQRWCGSGGSGGRAWAQGVQRAATLPDHAHRDAGTQACARQELGARQGGLGRPRLGRGPPVAAGARGHIRQSRARRHRCCHGRAAASGSGVRAAEALGACSRCKQHCKACAARHSVKVQDWLWWPHALSQPARASEAAAAPLDTRRSSAAAAVSGVLRLQLQATWFDVCQSSMSKHQMMVGARSTVQGGGAIQVWSC